MEYISNNEIHLRSYTIDSKFNLMLYLCSFQVGKVKEAIIESQGVGVTLLLIMGVGVNITIFYQYFMIPNIFHAISWVIAAGSLYNSYFFAFCYLAQKFTNRVSNEQDIVKCTYISC